MMGAVMKVYLLRHGHAVAPAEVGGQDAYRTLSKRGVEATLCAAHGLRRMGVAPRTVCSSPYPRAMQTAELTADILSVESPAQSIEALMPGADPEALGKLIDREGDTEAIMLVGHNPDLEEFVGWLIGQEGAHQIHLGKGACAALHLERPVQMGCAILEGLWQNDHLAGMKD